MKQEISKCAKCVGAAIVALVFGCGVSETLKKTLDIPTRKKAMEATIRKNNERR